MKILITTDTYAPIINGVVTSIQSLAHALMLMGHETRILTLSQGLHQEGYQNGVYYMRSIPCGIYPDARVTFPLGNPLLRDIMLWKPDIIHSQTEFSSFWCAKYLAKKLRVPLIHTCHTLYEDYTHYFAPNRQIGTAAVRSFTRLLSKKVDLLCAPSRKVQNTLLHYGVHAPIAVLPTGIDLARFATPLSAQERRAMKRAISIPENGLVLLALGRLAAEKNYDHLIRALIPVLQGNLDAYMVFVGDGPHRATLEALTAASGLSDRVRFTGMVPSDQVPAYYRLGDIFVCASNSETQGLTYLEAMASGLPQVVRRDDCLNGVILQGENGYQYDTADECAAFADRLLADVEKRRELSLCAENHAKYFGMQYFGERASACYEALIPVRVPSFQHA